MNVKHYSAALALIFPLTSCASGESELSPCDPAQVTTTTFRITSAMMPRDQFHSTLIGEDFDGDGKADNSLGAASAGLVGLEPQYDPGAAMKQRLQSNGWTLQLSQCTQSNVAEATLEHDGVREVAPAIRNGDQFKISGINLSAPATWLADASSEPMSAGWLATHQAQLVVNVTPTALIGRFAATVDPSQLRARITQPIAMFLQQPQRGKLLRFAMDADHDGVITPLEVGSNRAFLDLTAPDIADAESKTAPVWTSVAFDIEATRIR